MRSAVFSFVLMLGVALVGCGKREVPSDAQIFQVKGVIRSFAADNKTVTIEHEDVPGFMPAMTMPFYIKEPLRYRFQVGDAVSFRLVVTKDDSWIQDVKRIDPGSISIPVTPAAAQSETAAEKRLKEGDPMPEFQLTAQDGRQVTLEMFKGKPFLLTFFFTRCPIPNFCPLMSRNFKTIQDAIKAEPGIAATRLVSISFDPEHDTPEVLKNYGEGNGADPAIWTFVTGEPPEIQKLTGKFAVYVKPEQGTITHGLATALVDSKGVIRTIWRGNAWTTDEVLTAVRKVSAE